MSARLRFLGFQFALRNTASDALTHDVGIREFLRDPPQSPILYSRSRHTFVAVPIRV